MNHFAITADHLSKQFPVRRHSGQALRDSTEQLLRAPFQLGRQKPAAKDSPWALRDISFQIARGECVGIIGHNGAGKSVLLRLLARVTCPTSGYAELRGRVSAVLDVGAGFKRELSGRENIFLCGAILGMRHREIASKFEAIVEFSGLGDFVEQPLKGYSNGMLVRLAFAVAAHLEPDILLMDEVLAVADAEFHHLSVERLLILAHEERTIILVGHDLEMIRKLCTRVLWLEHGRIVADGAADAVIGQYQKSLANKNH